MKRTLRIVFMGTPDFAVPSLDILVKNGYNVVGVVTAPDKQAGRGQQLQQSAVKRYATENNLHLLQPDKLKNEQFLESLKELNANLFIVVAFRMLPEVVWKMPEYGTFNLHASLLPQYRGAAPINWAVINGEQETGVTTFFLKHEIDTGDILLQERIPIVESDNAGSVHDKLMKAGSTLVIQTVQGIENNSITEKPQASIINNPASLKHAPKIFKENCQINWNQPSVQIHNLIKGLSPYPAAFTYLKGKVLKIYTSQVNAPLQNRITTQTLKSVEQPASAIEISTDTKTYFSIKCNDGWLDILELQLEGKKRMSIIEFLRGYSFN